MGVSTAAVPVLHTETNSNANANPTSVPTATTRQRRQLRKGKSCSVDPPNRLQRRNEVLCLAKAVYCRAGCSLLATTATTSGSFFANLASSLPVLREFGQFVGLVVAANYALTMTLFVAALVLHHRRCCFAGVVANTCRRRRRHRRGAGDDLDEDDADVEDGSGGGDNDEEARPDDDNDDEEAVDDIDGEIVNGGGDDNRSTDSSVAGSDQKDADITADPSPPPPPLPPPSSPPPPRSTSTSSTKKSDNRNKSRSALVRRYVFFLQRRRFLMACGCLTGVLLLFGWGAAKAKSASDPPQLFNQDHNLGVAYDLWGLVGGSVGANEGSANGANTAPQQPSSTLGGGLGSSGGGGGGTPAPVPSPTQPAPTPPPPSSPTPSPAGSTTAAPTPHPIPAPPPSAAAFSSHPSPPPSSTNRPTLSPNPNPTAPSLNPTLTSQPTPLPTEAARKNTVTVSLFWDLVLNKDGSGGASEVPLLERTGPRDKQEKAEAEAEEGGGEAGTLSESEQALLLWTCLEAMKDPTLQVVRRDSSCFMLDLHEWLTGEKQGAGLPLPPSQFRDRALDFYYAQGGDPDPTAAPGEIGVAPPSFSSSSPPSAQWKYASLDCGSGELLWLRAEFKTRLPSSAKASDVLAFFDDDWTRFARTANERYAAAARDDATAAAAAGNNSNDVDLDDVVTDGGESAAPSSSAATQTERARRSKALAKPRLRVKVASWAWVRASTEVQMVGSTLTAFAVSFGVACACVLGFTQNLRVSVAAMLGVLCVNLALVAFMVLGLEWALGAVEAVAITVFVGFSVDYIIHVAHGYASFPPPSLPPSSSSSSSSSSPLSERGKQGDDNDSDDGDDKNGGCGGHGVRVGENNDDDCTGGDKDGVRVGDEKEGVFGVSIMRGEEGRDSEEFKEGVASEDDVEVEIEVGKGVEDGVNRIQYEKRKKGETPCSANRSRSSGTGGGGSSCCGNSRVGRRGETTTTTTTTTTGRDRARDAAAEHLAETLETLYPSIVGAALTSGVSAVSLALCTVQIFVKMGLTLLCCTALSALFALLVLPAFLLAFAPQTAPPSPLTPQPRSLQHKDNSETKASTRVATKAAARAAATLPGAEAVTEVASGPLYTSSAVLESSSSSSKFGVAVAAGSFQLHDIGSSLGYAEVGLGNRAVVL